MLGRVVSPADCALLLNIPPSEDEFLADLRDGAPKDLAKSLLACHPGMRPADLYTLYHTQLGTLADQIAHQVTAAGVAVYRQATLQQLPDICTRHPVVTLIAHCKYLMLEPADVLDVQRFHSRLQSGDGSGLEETVTEPRGIDVALRDDPAVCAAGSAEDLVRALLPRLERARDHYFWVDRIGATSSGRGPADITRALLEESYPGCFAPGHCLEMGDRLCTIPEFIKKVPCGYDGLFDLTVCNAMIIAESLRRARKNCHAICLVSPADAKARLVIYRWTIRQIEKRSQPYEDAAMKCHTALLDEIRKRRNEVSVK